MRLGNHPFPLTGLLTLAILTFSLDASAQGAVPKSAGRDSLPVSTTRMADSAPRTVAGRVRRPVRYGENGDSTGMGPAANVWVTLHRVGEDSAGALDSVRTDQRGNYRMTYKPWGVADAVYFASSTWDGITYFTAPLRSVDAKGDESEITVFDTTSAAFPMSVKGRHFIVSKSDSTDSRTVVEVFEISNDSLRTLVSVDTVTLRPTWSTAIPATATDVRVSQSDISPNAFLAKDGRASVFSPISPGLKQIAFTYRVPNSSFPLALKAEGGAVVFEVLIEEPRGGVSGEGFTAVDPVSLEGRNFRRFLAQDVRPDERIVIELPSSGGFAGRNLYIAGLLTAIGFLMLVVLARSMQRSIHQRTGAPALPERFSAESGTPSADRLAQEIAALDSAFARQTNPGESVVQAYNARRNELRRALAHALGHADHDGH